MTIERRFSLLQHDHSQYLTAGGNVTITGSWSFTLPVSFGSPAKITLGNIGTNSTAARFGQGAGDTTAGYVAGVGLAGNIINGSVAGDMAFRSESGALLFSRDAGATIGVRLLTGNEWRVGGLVSANFLNANDQTFITYSNASSTSNYWSWYNATGSTRQGYIGLTSSAIVLAAENSLPLILNTGGTNRLTIDSAGAWTLNGSTGAVGAVLSSNNTTTPTWRTKVDSWGSSDRISSDFVITSNAAYQDTGLESDSLATGVTYAYEVGYGCGVDATPGMSVQLVHTSGLGSGRANRHTVTGTTVTGEQYAALPVHSMTTTNEFYTILKGHVVAGGTGTLKVQAKQNTSSATPVQLRAGSYLRVWRVDGV